MDYDVIVIGSGFGGSVSACRLAEKGKKVLILERGRRWDKNSYPREPGDGWIWNDAAPHLFNGWVDIGYFGDMSVARGAGVGGGSLIYASVSIEAKPQVFEDGWPKEVSYEVLKPYYDRVGEMLNVQKIPSSQYTERFHIMKEGAEGLGFGDRFHAVDLAVNFDPNWNYDQQDPFNEEKSQWFTNPQGQQQGTCVHCGNCDIGCPVYAKNTLDLNYIPLAEKNGAEVRPLHRVEYIEPIEAGYRIHYDRLEDCEKQRGTLTASRVILAAGSMGSTEILLRSKKQYKTLPKISERLGYGWSSNGDFVTPAWQTDGRKANPTQGPTISSAIDLLDGKYQGAQIFIEDGGFPDVLGNYMEEKTKWWRPFYKRRMGMLLFGLRKMIRKRNPVDEMMVWFGQAVDAADGQLYLGRTWYAPWRKRVKVKWNVRRSLKTMKAMESLHRELAGATGGKPLVPFTWTLWKDLITPHPLGGCAMADNKSTGVVDHKGEVFDYPELYVLDGATIPRAIGLNPSRTIAALAERAVELMDS